MYPAEEKTYDLCLPERIVLLAMLSLPVLVGIGLVVWGLLSGGRDGLPWFVGVLWLAVMCLPWGQVLLTPYRIVVSVDGTVAFKSVLRTRQFHLSEVREIRPQPREFGFFILDFGRGKQRFLAQFTGFHEFIIAAKAANPGVVIQGC